MSTATVDHGLYAVPTPPQKERLTILLALRHAARRALDRILALPRAATGWVWRHTRALLDAIGANPTLTRVTEHLQALGGLLRTIGPATTTVAVLSIPAVWRGTVRAARWLSTKVTTGASTAWRWIRTALAKFGPTGERVAQRLEDGAAALAPLTSQITSHSITRTALTGISSIARLARPVSHSLVVHRLLARFAPAPWLHVILEILTLPFILGPTLATAAAAGPRRAPVTQPETADQTAPTPEDDADPRSTDGAAHSPNDTSDWDDLMSPRNRAERRAQQQAQARAKRARARH